jgi:hypothetical protein
MDSSNNIAYPLDVLLLRERRHSIRYNSRLPTRIHTKTKSDRIGVSRNLSSDGALIVTSSRFAIGERAMLQFPFDLDPANAVSVLGRVVRLQVNAQPAGIWQSFACGIEFFEPLHAELQQFLLALSNRGNY